MNKTVKKLERSYQLENLEDLIIKNYFLFENEQERLYVKLLKISENYFHFLNIDKSDNDEFMPSEEIYIFHED
jgi:hypothetical protein